MKCEHNNMYKDIRRQRKDYEEYPGTHEKHAASTKTRQKTQKLDAK